MKIIILLVIGWLLMGFCSFVYWWTKNYNFTTDDISLALLVSLLGPFSFIAGWVVLGKEPTKRSNRVIIRRKEKL